MASVAFRAAVGRGSIGRAMNAAEARAVAGRWWAEENARSAGEALCAFVGGSVAQMADAETVPPTSDVDVIVVVPALDPHRHQPRKRPYGGLYIETRYVPREEMSSAEALVCDFALAPQLMAGRSLWDPDGMLGDLRATMAPEFARRLRVRQRCASLRAHASSLIELFAASDSLAYLNGVAFHVVRCLAQMMLLADLRNPTVKWALVKGREVLAAQGVPEVHDELLRPLALDGLAADDILAVAADCRRAIGEACRWLRTPFPGSNLLCGFAQTSLDMDVPAALTEGSGREIFVWVATLYGHAANALANDAPADVAAPVLAAYAAAMARVGGGTAPEARARMLACRPLVERMTTTCDAIIAKHPRLVD